MPFNIAFASAKRLTFFILAIAVTTSVHAEGPQQLTGSSVSPSFSNPAMLVALASEPQWQKILFYVPRWILPRASLVDDSNFFLSKDGKKNPLLELQATIAAFTTGSASERQEALCKYPARRLWLERKTGASFPETEPEHGSEICKRYRMFRKSVHTDRASLIFSSYFAGNPASLFGHTLLKFSRSKDSAGSTNDLLDYGFNHAAYPTTLNPFLYAPMGLTGFFPGFVSLMPYYVKVQEYNNAESRDLWEYELALTPAEIELMLLSVFELSTHRIDYFYFDDNCSLIMMAFLDIARPQLQLTEKFPSWVIPGDTVRVVFEQKGLVSTVKFRPSNIRRYLQLESELITSEKAALTSLLESKRNKNFSSIALEGLDTLRQMHVLDTLLEYIDADEQLSGGREPEKWKIERPQLLQKRAQLGIPSQPLLVKAPDNEAPHRAYPPTRVTAGVVQSMARDGSSRTGGLLGLRPALHTLDSPISGMGSDLGIEFLNLSLLIVGKRVSLREFIPLSVESISTSKPHLTSRSWRFDFAAQQSCFAGCKQASAGVELGRAFPFASPDNRLSLRATLRLGTSEIKGPFAETGVASMINMPISDDKRFVLRMNLTRVFSAKETPEWNPVAQSSFVLRPRQPWELSLSGEFSRSESLLSARTSFYF